MAERDNKQDDSAVAQMAVSANEGRQGKGDGSARMGLGGGFRL